MHAIILSIGNELTLGQTVDTNTAWLSQRLAEIGIPVGMHVTVADEIEPIAREMKRACALAPLLLVTGGLGPTEDDLTRHALAAVMGGVPLELHEESVSQIRCFFTHRALAMPEANLIQAMLPRGSVPICNTCGTAPGIRTRVGGCEVFIMPGVPREMRVMYDRDVLPAIRATAAGGVILAKNLWCHGAGESVIGDRIRDLMVRGRNPTVGTTAQQMVIGIRIHARGVSHEAAADLLGATAKEIKQRLGPLVYGEDDDTLWSVVGRLLAERGRTVSTAESCTGGLIAQRLTDVPGSSAYFLEAVITYSNAAKTRLLNIPADMIARHGAVSAEVARAMATQARMLSGSDEAISVTGIAGPTGGTADKPVGLVYIGLADEIDCEVTEHRIGDTVTRDEIRDRACKFALNRLRLKLLR